MLSRLTETPRRPRCSIAVMVLAVCLAGLFAVPASAFAQHRGLGRGWSKVKAKKRSTARRRVIRVRRARPSRAAVRRSARRGVLSRKLRARIRSTNVSAPSNGSN